MRMTFERTGGRDTRGTNELHIYGHALPHPMRADCLRFAALINSPASVSPQVPENLSVIQTFFSLGLDSEVVAF